MTILRESPWYAEILNEGLEKGLKQGIEHGQEDALLLILEHRFGVLSTEPLKARVRELNSDELREMMRIALDATSLTAVIDHLNNHS